MPKFKVGYIIQDDCGCRYKILKVGRKYYQCINMEDIKLTKWKFLVELKVLDKRAIIVKGE